MNLKEYADEKGISLAEAKKQTGLTHWKQEVPESCDEIPEVAESDIVIETESKQEPSVSREYMIGQIKGRGTQSPYYHLKDSLGL